MPKVTVKTSLVFEFFLILMKCHILPTAHRVTKFIKSMEVWSFSEKKGYVSGLQIECVIKNYYFQPKHMFWVF